MNWLFAALTGYVLGSIPFGLLLTRAFGAGDVRKIGSGSIGATNVLRTGRKGLAAATVLLDAGKGALAVVLAARLWPGCEGVAAVAAVAGHCFPVWLKFHGGKGVATFLGVLLALLPVAALVYAVIWIGLLLTLRISSVAGMAAAASAPMFAFFHGDRALVPLLLGLALLIIWKHQDNIRRLRRGEEPRVGKRAA
jgi:glycerol-3-phosphate acyltransferase PlsY